MQFSGANGGVKAGFITKGNGSYVGKILGYYPYINACDYDEDDYLYEDLRKYEGPGLISTSW